MRRQASDRGPRLFLPCNQDIRKLITETALLDMTELSSLVGGLTRLHAARVLCVGDVMLDHYVYGQVERVSPEAPIPILRLERETRTLGGAGNVVRHIYALGANACLMSVLGEDAAGREISQLLAGEIEAHMVIESGRLTRLRHVISAPPSRCCESIVRVPLRSADTHTTNWCVELSANHR
jgi:bifunctional ADP-heptose synthase (sugar kinase/adenylyltransferase)